MLDVGWRTEVWVTESIEMWRREFIALIGGSAATLLFARLSTFAQQNPEQTTPEQATPDQSSPPLEAPPQDAPSAPARIRRIGVLIAANRRDRQVLARLSALKESLAAKGWTEKDNLRIDMQWSAASDRRLGRNAAELIAHSPDLVIATDRATAQALHSAGRDVPLVFINVADPVGAGLVTSLEQPGGNATGVTRSEYGASTAWPELLKRIAPNVMHVAILGDPELPADQALIAAIQTVAPGVGLEALAVDADSMRELQRAVAGFSRTPNGGLIVSMPALTSRERRAVVALAARFKLPAVYSDREFVKAGGLASYGPDLTAEYRLAADYADRILKGEKPADIPVQTSAKFSTAINLKTAKALKLTIPPALLDVAGGAID
jgi:putative ABC transport system substrate-binding protein